MIAKPDKTASEPERSDRLSSYDYDLPKRLIAQFPKDRRDRSRLMHISRIDGKIEHTRFDDLPNLLQPGDLLVANDSKVIPARLLGRKQSGGGVEVFLSRRFDAQCWEALLKMSGRARKDMIIHLDPEGSLRLEEDLGGGLWRIRFLVDGEALDLIRRIGGIPLPPYIERNGLRDRIEEDRERYQTVYAGNEGAVAAPTAGLHFTQSLLDEIRDKGIGFCTVTLHVGLGTFQPIRQKDLRKVRLHTESYHISDSAIGDIIRTKQAGGRIVAVGTTSVRVLESIARLDRWEEHGGETSLFLKPGNPLLAVDAMITNFHLPRSSLIMLVAAFAGKDLIDRAYEEAVDLEYRFYSYGDAMFIE